MPYLPEKEFHETEIPFGNKTFNDLPQASSESVKYKLTEKAKDFSKRIHDLEERERGTLMWEETNGDYSYNSDRSNWKFGRLPILIKMADLQYFLDSMRLINAEMPDKGVLREAWSLVDETYENLRNAELRWSSEAPRLLPITYPDGDLNEPMKKYLELKTTTRNTTLRFYRCSLDFLDLSLAILQPSGSS